MRKTMTKKEETDVSGAATSTSQSRHGVHRHHAFLIPSQSSFALIIAHRSSTHEHPFSSFFTHHPSTRKSILINIPVPVQQSIPNFIAVCPEYSSLELQRCCWYPKLPHFHSFPSDQRLFRPRQFYMPPRRK